MQCHSANCLCQSACPSFLFTFTKSYWFYLWRFHDSFIWKSYRHHKSLRYYHQLFRSHCWNSLGKNTGVSAFPSPVNLAYFHFKKIYWSSWFRTWYFPCKGCWLNYIYIYFLKKSCSITFITKYWIFFVVSIQDFVVIHSTYMHLLTPNFHSVSFLFPHSLGNQKSVLYVCESICFIDILICVLKFRFYIP